MFLLAAFRGGNHGALFALSGNLLLHGLQNHSGRRQVFDFVTQYLHAPVQSRFINGAYHRTVDEITFFERFIEFHLTDHASERGLRELRDSDHVVARAVACARGISHLEKEHAID